MSEAETLLAYWQEHREQLRQSENQRSVLTNYVLIIVAALGGFIAQQDFTLATIPLSLLIVAVGFYGALTVAKYHERAEYHLSQARALTRTLVAVGALSDYRPALDKAREHHYGKYKRLHRVRLHVLWTSMHLAVSAYGATLVVIAWARA